MYKWCVLEFARNACFIERIKKIKKKKELRTTNTYINTQRLHFSLLSICVYLLLGFVSTNNMQKIRRKRKKKINIY